MDTTIGLVKIQFFSSNVFMRSTLTPIQLIRECLSITFRSAI